MCVCVCVWVCVCVCVCANEDSKNRLEGSVTHAVRNTLPSIAVTGCDSSSQYL